MKKRSYHGKNMACKAIIIMAAATSCKEELPVQPNILLFITDQQSAESMSNIIGNRYLNTPAMDYLAENGISFTNAYCANPLSVPSRSSMFTGRYPHEIGIQSNADLRNIDHAVFPSIGTIFLNAGYETGYTGKWHLPFDVKNKDSHGFMYTENIGNNGVDSAVARSAEDFLKHKHEKPFLLVASFVNPHNICEWARGQNLPDGPVGTPPSAADCPPLRKNCQPSENETDIMVQLRRSYQAARMFPVSGFSDDKWRQYTWSYYRMIEKVDSYIAGILNSLHESEYDENTIIILVSDHGDCQGAHRWNQKTVFFDEAAKVPFIISHKAIKPRESDHLVQTGVDLLPTMCDLAGISPVTGYPGKSLKGIVTGDVTENRNFVVVSNRSVQGDTIDGCKPEPNGRMVRTQRYKYWILDEGNRRETLYDLMNDPGEMRNVADDPEFKSPVEESRRLLEEWAVENNDPFFVKSAISMQ
jgi:arylsulfatase A-like enzyme